MRFDHRGKTWASTTHRQISLQAGGRSHRQRDVRLGRERVEASAERSAAGAREGAATGRDTPCHMRETTRGGRERRWRQSDRPVLEAASQSPAEYKLPVGTSKYSTSVHGQSERIPEQ